MSYEINGEPYGPPPEQPRQRRGGPENSGCLGTVTCLTDLIGCLTVTSLVGLGVVVLVRRGR